MSIVMSVNAGSSSLKFQVFKMPEEEVFDQCFDRTQGRKQFG